jgi:hypothetical protein
MNRRIIPTRSFSDALLDRYRQQGDAAADAVVARVAAEGGPRRVGSWLRVLATLDEDAGPEAETFVRDHSQLPDWADGEKMRRGLRFFQRHAADVGILLGCLSLPYTYLAADGVRVLMRSGRMLHDTRRRMEETGEFVFGVTNPNAWEKGTGRKEKEIPEAFRRLARVRLVHAAVRWFSYHGGWDAAAWGTPVNQEDMAGTNLSFSYLIVQGLRKNGVREPVEEEEAYLHFWNVAGYLSGVAEELLPQNLREAYVLGNAIARRQFRPTDEGRALTKALLTTIESFIPSAALKGIPAAQMRFLLGDDFADQLGIPEVPLEKRLVRLVPLRLFVGQPTGRVPAAFPPAVSEQPGGARARLRVR